MKPSAWFVLIAVLLLTIGSRTVHMASVAVLSAGTTVNVRTVDPIAADSSLVGMKFNAVVDDPVMDSQGEVVIPRGSHATLEAIAVETSSNMKGRDRIKLKLHSVHVGDRTYAVATTPIELKGHSEGKRAARKIIGGAGIGAAIGGIFGGGTGAAIGGVAGGTTGGIVAGSGKTHLNVPAETRLHFRLDAPVRIER
jgi:hypothetical protein